MRAVSFGVDPQGVAKELALAVLLLCLLPNLAFYSTSCWLGIGRPLINLDYCLALLLMAFGWRWLGVFAAVFFISVDIFALVSQVLVLPRVTDFFYILKFAFMASGFYLSLLGVVIAIVMMILILCYWGGVKLKKLPALLVFNILVVGYAMYANSSMESADIFYRKAGGAIVESQSITLLQRRNSNYLERFHLEGEALAPALSGSATAAWRDAAELDRLGGRLLLVVVESWGVPVDPDIQRSLLAPLREAVGGALHVRALPFAGVTLDGELRELCGLRSNHYNLSGVTSGFETCLPNRLLQQGYVTAGMHGAAGVMYDRMHWYPRAGFVQTIFQENKLRARRCYSFPGVCDLDLFADVESFFSKPGKRFMYWLTLNSHSRYDLRDLENDVFDCEYFAIPVDSESCRNLKLQAQFFNGLARLVRSDTMKDVQAVIVGDHSPMILDLKEKKMVFVEAQVPWISFAVK